MEEEEDVAELATTATTPKQPVFPVWEKALRVFVGRRSTLTALGAYLVALALPILLTGIAFQYDVHLDTGITSFRARDEPTAQKQDAAQAALQHDAARPIRPQGDHQPIVQPRQSVDSFWLTLVYETVPPGGDLLQQEHVDHIRQVEDAVASAPHYADFCGVEEDDGNATVAKTTCRPPLSLLAVAQALQSEAHAHPNGDAATALALAAAMTGGDNASGNASSSSSSSVSDAALLSLARSLPSLDQYVGDQKLFGSQHDVRWFFDQAFLERRAPICTSLRSAFVFALPLEGYTSETDRSGAQTAAYAGFVQQYTALLRRFENGPTTRVLHAGAVLTEAEVTAIVLSDLKLAGVAVVAVFVVLWVHTDSLWITAHAMLGLVLSFPVSYFAFRVVFGIQYLTFLAAMVPFVVLGVGCDDVVCFVDTWRQTGASTGDWTVVKRAYWTAGKTMLATSFTTAAAFSANLVSYMPPTRMLGLFAAIAVVVNYLVVMSLLPAAMLLAHHARQSRAAQYAILEEEVVDEAGTGCVSVDAPTPAVALSALAQPSKWPRFNAAERLETWFRGQLAPSLFKMRFAVVCFFLLLDIGALYMVATRLRPADAVPSLLPADHYLQRIDVLLRTAFTSQMWTEVTIVWGVAGIDRTGVDPNDFTNLGEAVFDPLFDITSEEVQAHILATCESVQAQAERLELTPDAGSQDCVMQQFARSRQRVGLPFPVASANFTEEFDGWRRGAQREMGRNRELVVGGEKGERVLALVARYWVDVSPLDAPTSHLRTLIGRWEDGVIKPANSEPAAHHGARAFQASSLWLRLGLERSVLHSAKLSPAISLCAAFAAVLGVTRSLTAALVASLTIAQVIVMMLALLVAVGWEFGVIEALCVSILIGTSIDYCIHMAVSYVEAGRTSPQERLLESLGRTGSTITGGACTTIVSSLMLCFCQITVFNKIALVMIFNTVVGYAMALLFFASLMSIVYVERRAHLPSVETEMSELTRAADDTPER